jgi:hypothetical protein
MSPPGTNRRPRLGLSRMVPVAAAVACFYAFLPALSAGFVNWDDEVSFLENPYYQEAVALEPR